MSYIKWFLTNFDARWLIGALILFAMAAGSLVIGYKREPPESQMEFALDWWKKNEGLVLQQSQIVEGFNRVASNPSIRDKIQFRLRKKDGEIIDGSLISMSSGSGYIYTFVLPDGHYRQVPLPDIEQVTVTAVKL